MTAEPDVTFLVPVYGSEKTLARTLDSVFAQTLKNIECIAVDDASPDRSGEILKEYAAKEPRLKIVTLEQNSGTLVARKRGAAAASGKYIISLDPDDEFRPDGAEKLLKAATENSADIVHFHMIEQKQASDGSVKRNWSWCPARCGFLKGTDAILRDLLIQHGHYWSVGLKFIRRELYQAALADIEDFYCVMCEDLYMDLAIEKRAKNMLIISQKPYLYYIGSGISSKGKRSREAFLRLLPALHALELSTKMLPKEFQQTMHDIQVKQCRLLLARNAREVEESDQAEMVRVMQDYEFCRDAMKEAMKMPLLTGANDEDFLVGFPYIRKVIDFLLPKGSRRRLYVKIFVKRILGKG